MRRYDALQDSHSAGLLNEVEGYTVRTSISCKLGFRDSEESAVMLYAEKGERITGSGVVISDSSCASSARLGDVFVSKKAPPIMALLAFCRASLRPTLKARGVLGT